MPDPRALRSECSVTDIPQEEGIVGYSQSNVLEKIMLVISFWIDLNVFTYFYSRRIFSSNQEAK